MTDCRQRQDVQGIESYRHDTSNASPTSRQAVDDDRRCRNTHRIGPLRILSGRLGVLCSGECDGEVEDWPSVSLVCGSAGRGRWLVAERVSAVVPENKSAEEWGGENRRTAGATRATRAARTAAIGVEVELALRQDLEAALTCRGT